MHANKGNGYAFSAEICLNIASKCDRNLRSGLLQLQASKYTKSSSEGMMAPYKKQIREIAEMIFKEQTPGMLKNIRDKFYPLLVNCFEGSMVLKELTEAILNLPTSVVGHLSEEAIMEIIHSAAEHEKTLLCGSKAIYHLESYAVNVMEIWLRNKNRMSIE